jgi:hypothetical protein
MWRVDTLQPDGTVRREQRSQTFLGLSERAARAAFQPILDVVNAANQATPPVPKTSDTVNKAVSEWRKHAAVSLKPSTRRSAESHLRRRHILPLLGECGLEEMRRSAKVLKRNNEELDGILIGPSMAPRFHRTLRFRHYVSSHCSKGVVSFGPNFAARMTS